MIPLATNLSEDDPRDRFLWRPPVGMVNGTYHVYARIRDGSVTAGAYAPGALLIESADALQLLSPAQTTASDYLHATPTTVGPTRSRPDSIRASIGSSSGPRTAARSTTPSRCIAATPCWTETLTPTMKRDA